jgi:hypothetical protein
MKPIEVIIDVKAGEKKAFIVAKSGASTPS